MAVKAPKKVIEQLEEVRLSGRTNMIDVAWVQRVASDMDLHELVLWLEDQLVRRSYGVRLKPDAPYRTGMFEGFEPEEGEEA